MCIHLIPPPAVLPFPLGSSAFLWVTASLQLAPLLMPRPVSPHPLHHHPLVICYFHPIPKFRWFFSFSSSHSLNIGGLLTCVPVFSSLSQTLTLYPRKHIHYECSWYHLHVDCSFQWEIQAQNFLLGMGALVCVFGSDLSGPSVLVCTLCTSTPVHLSSQCFNFSSLLLPNS